MKQDRTWKSMPGSKGVAAHPARARAAKAANLQESALRSSGVWPRWRGEARRSHKLLTFLQLLHSQAVAVVPAQCFMVAMEFDRQLPTFLRQQLRGDLVIACHHMSVASCIVLCSLEVLHEPQVVCGGNVVLGHMHRHMRDLQEQPVRTQHRIPGAA
jgi:hypothetical protein